MADLTVSADIDTLMGAANFAAARTSLGLVIGTNVQAYDAALDALAAGSDFVQFSGPASTTKVFTLPNATSTILTTNAAVTVAQGGTGIASGTSGGVPYFSGSTTIASSAALAANAIVIGGGAGAAPATTTTGTGVLTALGNNVGSAGAFITFNGAAGTPSSLTLTNATGLPTAGLVDDSVTLAKIQNAAASSKLIGSGDTGSGSNYVEITLGTNLSMSGTTLNATGGAGGGDVSGPGSSTDNNIVLWDGGDGTLVKDSPVTIDPVTGDMSNVGNITGGALAVTSAAPTANDGAALGSGTVSWSDLFLASGALINFANGNAVITHSSAVLTVSTGDLRVTTAGTNSASCVTVGGTQTLTNKTLTSPTLTTPALGTPSSGTLTNCTGLPASGIAAGVLGGNVTLGESTGQIVLDAALSADGTWSGIMVAGTAGTTLAFGDLIYLAAADSRWELADADAASTSGDVILGICVLAAAADGNATNVLLYGKVRADAAFPALTIGAPAYAGTTAGDIQTAQPSGTDDVIRVVGFGLTADELFFNPAGSYITHT